MPLRDEGGKRARTRARLLEEAIGLFRKQGVRATRLSQIASQAEVATATLYTHFATKSALAEAWRDGCAKEIRTLLLSGCDIGPIPMRSLRAAFESGWTQLVHLDLRKNLLGNEGACTVAHCILQGLLPKMRKLLLQSNQIGDAGCTAVCKAVTAEKVGCPEIEQVNLRFNRMSPLQLRHFASSAWARHPALQV